MELNTERLKIVALSREQSALLLEGTEKLEQALGLEASGGKLDAHTQEAMACCLAPITCFQCHLRRSSGCPSI